MTAKIEIITAGRVPRLDDRPLKKRVGLVILATDHTTEVDFQRMVASDDIGVYVSRIHYANPVTPENLLKMQPSLTAGAALILPDEALDALMYSCTSASVVIGDRNIEAAIHAAKPGAPVVTPTAAAVKGLQALGARRISVLTPYTVETSRPMADYFADLGFAIDRFTCLGLADDREMARIAPDEIAAFARQATAPQSDALFISCTAVRAAQVAARIEAEIDRPVVTSNLATAWACLRLCGDDRPRPELGRLMAMPYPEG
ncbi:ectoine utilization protein EutA [Rhizobium hidalgonense]|uniref:Ectoine utilization protein EutA n=1 Tax=Rhizobium hidalgonense TaxID=1538159 RepID=A0A2A6KKG8_9HYPH|nr:ectoine utilization protein EutA [Rhizobium hidalgonense]EJC72278.1 ectoine utilization protein EutA [Rhizobium leguminosarum bv. trifolii WSM2012]MDR9772180.1 ectoine utilization protein EutA [Rhizobium hidalgonense]MDR9810239.1 ectoine utilization protein EutA [Rhizobium hidalgonense]MDR9817752.1 ectoine utilization protein EutA [Rhizobium hidalgonense]PDT24905.1 ectoine utilization protein EutA [Rhizobium hidalgonense]